MCDYSLELVASRPAKVGAMSWTMSLASPRALPGKTRWISDLVGLQSPFCVIIGSSRGQSVALIAEAEFSALPLKAHMLISLMCALVFLALTGPESRQSSLASRL